jgi:hypothetical protein
VVVKVEVEATVVHVLTERAILAIQEKRTHLSESLYLAHSRYVPSVEMFSHWVCGMFVAPGLRAVKGVALPPKNSNHPLSHVSMIVSQHVYSLYPYE